MLQQTLAIFLVLGLLLASLWLLRRQGIATLKIPASLKGLGRKAQPSRLRIVERLALTPQHSLHLIEVENQLILFATSPAGCQPVTATLPSFSAVSDGALSLKSGASC